MIKSNPNDMAYHWGFSNFHLYIIFMELIHNTEREERIMKKRMLKNMPFDMMFEIDRVGRQELCHATGFEVYLGNGDPDDPEESGNWWNEYVDSNGEFHYGR